MTAKRWLHATFLKYLVSAKRYGDEYRALAIELVERGHRVIVIAPLPSGDRVIDGYRTTMTARLAALPAAIPLLRVDLADLVALGSGGLADLYHLGAAGHELVAQRLVDLIAETERWIALIRLAHPGI